MAHNPLALCSREVTTFLNSLLVWQKFNHSKDLGINSDYGDIRNKKRENRREKRTENGKEEMKNTRKQSNKLEEKKSR